MSSGVNLDSTLLEDKVQRFQQFWPVVLAVRVLSLCHILQFWKLGKQVQMAHKALAVTFYNCHANFSKNSEKVNSDAQSFFYVGRGCNECLMQFESVSGVIVWNCDNDMLLVFLKLLCKDLEQWQFSLLFCFQKWKWNEVFCLCQQLRSKGLVQN